LAAAGGKVERPPLPEDLKQTRRHVKESIAFNERHAKEHMKSVADRKKKLRKLTPKYGQGSANLHTKGAPPSKGYYEYMGHFATGKYKTLKTDPKDWA
jgi:hypothetical protein